MTWAYNAVCSQFSMFTGDGWAIQTDESKMLNYSVTSQSKCHHLLCKNVINSLKHFKFGGISISTIVPTMSREIVHGVNRGVNNIPSMQFFTGISRNAQSKSLRYH